MLTKKIYLALLVLVMLSVEGFLFGQAAPELNLDTGKQIYEAACIGCHGPAGKGQPESTLGFEKPPQFPDFSDCSGSTRERKYDWKATIHEGGGPRGWSEIMPSFAEALNSDQIEKVASYLRSLCQEPSWPMGELNLPRPLVTEKAFPEDEAILTTSINTKSPGVVSSELSYEKRFGVRNQLEFALPFSFIHPENASWLGGIGDFVLGYKRTVLANSRTGSILSFQGEAAIPTGNKSRGLGSGVTTFETFAAFGQLLPGRSFIQLQGGADLPTDTSKSAQSTFFRTVAGKTFAQNQGFGRIWTPMVEFLSERDLVSAAKTNWDIVPQMQVSLSKRQHILASIGVRTPMNNTAGRQSQLMFYLLWDWFDGGIREGW
jgi:mono/diheme cytochrome c family protein